jgi:hypothetical protein
MQELPTCGRGLAEHASLPAKVGELIASLAENLELHMKTLVLEDEHARTEHRAYLKLAQQGWAIAGQLQEMAKQMSGYRELPMGKHDEQVLSDQAFRKAFERFVRVEEELSRDLARWLARERVLVAQMREPE